MLNINDMKKKLFCLMPVLFTLFGLVFSQENPLIPVSIAVNGIAKGKGNVYIAVYSTKESYKQEKPDYSFIGAGEEEAWFGKPFSRKEDILLRFFRI